MLGATPIGNATLIAYDDIPILATDPWFGDEDPAYYGSWILSHVIPVQCKQDILRAKHIWFSHGHPDHLNPASLERLKGKHILLPDHVGGRIKADLEAAGFEVDVLPDREWVELSPRIKVLCITTSIQDAVLLVDINGHLFLDVNDSGGRNCGRFVRSIASNYRHTYLMQLSGFGDTDMINLYDDDGKFIIPPGLHRPVGVSLNNMAKRLGAKTVIPFSSFHAYQREDSIWAEKYVASLDDYRQGFNETFARYVEPFSHIDCSKNGEAYPLNPLPVPRLIKKPEEFGDDWNEPLTNADVALIADYLKRKDRVREYLSFVNFRVGGKDNFIALKGKKDKGVTFEAPRNSLMTSIKYEVFDDMLNGNFMKTTLHNLTTLYDGNLNYLITKWGDNGRVQSEAEVRAYLQEYRGRAGAEWYFDNILEGATMAAKAKIAPNTFLYKVARSVHAMLL